MKSKLPDIYLKQAMYLEDEGRFADAEQCFIKASKPKVHKVTSYDFITLSLCSYSEAADLDSCYLTNYDLAWSAIGESVPILHLIVTLGFRYDWCEELTFRGGAAMIGF